MRIKGLEFDASPGLRIRSLGSSFRILGLNPKP